MKDQIISLIEENNVISGVIILIIAVLVIVFQARENNSFKMKDHGLLSWKGFVYTWGVILSLLMIGLFLIFTY